MLKCRVTGDRCRNCIIGECIQRVEYIDKTERNDICAKAVKKFGCVHQENKAVEEMSELIKALLKMRDGLISLDELIEEMVDVKIMLHQLRLIYGWNEEIEQRKLIRLKELVEDGEGD